MQVGHFRIGMRTFKSALSVMLCVLIFHIFGREEPLIAALSAVFSLRQNLTTTVSFGKSRMVGNLIGGFMSIIFVLVKQATEQDFLVDLLFLPLLVALIIIISDGINNNDGIIAAVATILLITMTIPENESIIAVLNRILDTFIGVGIAILLNVVIRPPQKEQVVEVLDELETLQQQEAVLLTELADIQQKIAEKKE